MQLPADLAEQAWKIVQSTVLPIVLILVIALIVIRLASLAVHGIVKTLLDRETSEGTARELSAVEVGKRMDTLEGLGANVVRFFVVIIAAVMILDKLNINIGPAVAGLGVVGIAVGFGTQSIVRDYFTGALILVENQFSKGDVVTIAGVSGTVEDFSLRRTTLRDLDGVVHTVPNGEIKVASNKTRVWARINQNVTVAYGTDIDRAIRVVNDVGDAMAADPDWRRRLMEAPHVERVEALGEYGVTIKVLCLVRATEQWAAGGELRKRLLAAFATHGIEIPRPQRVVLAPSPQMDPFAQGGTALEGPTQDDLSVDAD
jgi:moderate conductance mechanosensitive channel